MSLRWNPLERALPAPKPVRLGGRLASSAGGVARAVRGSVLGLGLLAAAATAPACQGPVTEEDLQLWTHNDIGLAKMAEVVTDPQQPLETRIRGLEVVVERGQPMRVRDMLDKMSDKQAEVVAGLVRELTDHIDKRSEAQYDAKDALMTLFGRFTTPEQQDQIQQRVAAWAFSDITWETPQAEVQDKIGQRITSGQIVDLGPYGWQGAAILISHGFVVDTMADYLGKATDPQAGELLLRGLQLTHQRIGLPEHHLEILRKLGTSSAAAYLMKIYRNDQIDPQLRAAAFNTAIEMGAEPAVKGKPAPLTAELLEIMDGKNPQDRWLAAVSLVQIEGATKLADVLARFKDDKVYDQAEEDPAKSVVDLCMDVQKLGHAKASAPVFLEKLKDPNRIVRAISIVCLKATRTVDARPSLAELARLDGTPEDVSVDDFLGEQLTLGRLAANAVQGLDLLAAAEAEQKSGQLDATELDFKAQQIVVLLKEVGEEYTTSVDKFFGDWRVQYKANPEKFRKDTAPAGTNAAGAKPTQG